MNHTTVRSNAAIAAALVLGLTSGCSILHFDRGTLGTLVPISQVQAAVEAAASGAPDSAEPAYTRLRADFNAYISNMEAAVGVAGNSFNTARKVNFNDYAIGSDAAVQRDLQEFAAAAPTTPSLPVFTSAMNANAVVAKVYPEVSAIHDSRSDQAALLNRELESLKLLPWELVHSRQNSTR